MITVVKLGGSLLENGARADLLAPLAAWEAAGERLLVVHGGGKTLTALLEKLGVTSHFHNGLRVTDDATREAALMALAGNVNTRLVGSLNQALAARQRPPRAVGLTGLDGASVLARRLHPELGWVGESQPGDPRLLRTLIEAGYIPVLASLAADQPSGELLNVNADIFAATCAALAGASRLLFITDVPGVLDREGRRLEQVRLSELNAMQQSGQISGGMLPKLSACRQALEAGVERVEILSAAALPASFADAYPHTRILLAAREGCA